MKDHRTAIGRAVLLGVAIGWLIGPTDVHAQDAKKQGENLAPYVPTPMVVVDKMLELAEVRSDDVVYDLGCGDGRIVVTAARRLGARGVGVDYDPVLVAEAKAEAKKHNVSHLVEIILHDAMTVDFSRATVLTLYLLPSSNQKLKPRIQNLLPPGTRIVTHDFRMRPWKPIRDAAITVPGSFYTHHVYAYRTPGGDTLSGTWTWSYMADGERRVVVLRLRENGAEITGEMIGPEPDQKAKVTSATHTDNRIELVVDRGGGATLALKGTLEGDRIVGHIEPSSGAGPWDWNPRRRAVNLDGQWAWATVTADGDVRRHTLTIKRTSKGVEGQLTIGENTYPIRQATTAGSRLQFTVPKAGARGSDAHYSGWIEGQKIVGTRGAFRSGGLPEPWLARRVTGSGSS